MVKWYRAKNVDSKQQLSDDELAFLKEVEHKIDMLISELRKVENKTAFVRLSTRRYACLLGKGGGQGGT